MTRALGALVFTMLLSGLVLGQASFNTTCQTTDLSGEWTEIPHEIGFTAELYDYSGLPTNAAGRMRFDAGDISEWSIPEFVCRPHPGVYNWFYGGGNRITKEIDPVTRELTAYHIQFFRAPDRPVYMDGRPHPPEWAPHTWAGFSTGKLRRQHAHHHDHAPEGEATSARTRRCSAKSHGHRVAHARRRHHDGDDVSRRSRVWRSRTSSRSASAATFTRSCRSSRARSVSRTSPRRSRISSRQESAYVADAAKKFGLPLEAIKGGKATLYPEYRQRLKELMK